MTDHGPAQLGPLVDLHAHSAVNEGRWVREVPPCNDCWRPKPRHAILSHTWGPDGSEVTFNDIQSGIGESNDGYCKLRFCAMQTQCDGLNHF